MSTNVKGAGGSGGGGSGKTQGNNAPSSNTAQSSSRSGGNIAPAAENSNTLANQVFRLALFDHLPRKQTSKDPDLIEEDRIIHPATVHLGLMFNKGIIRADDDRAHALIAVFVQIVQDYKTPPKKILREDLDKCVCKQVSYPDPSLLSMQGLIKNLSLYCAIGAILGRQSTNQQRHGQYHQIFTSMYFQDSTRIK